LFANTTEKIDQTVISKKQKVAISKTTDKTVYFWEVNTPTGYASGYTLSEAKAMTTIKLMATNDIVTYRIIEAYK
jgi:exopolysaccharide biosynthesis protein